MLPEARDAAYLWDMVEAARRIQKYTEGLTLDRYLKDDMVQSAVERRLEILGEAARRVSDPFKQSHPEIPWQKIIAQRNVLAHEYGDIVPLLDYLAGRMKPYDGHGWTVFNDWLDTAYWRYFDRRPERVALVTLDAIRVAVFPGCK